MGRIGKDLRFAVRSLRRSRDFTSAAVVTLALGIGLATAAFALLDGVLLRPLPYPASERLVVVWETDAHNDSFSESLSGPDLIDFRAQAKSFSGVAALSFPWFNLRIGDEVPQRITGGAATADFLPLLGALPLHGRLFSAAEDRPAGPRVVVLGHALWQRSFGADPGVVGRNVRLDGQPYEVIGVLPSGFRFDEAELFVPLHAAAVFLDLRGVHSLHTVARLRRGATMERAQAEVDLIGAALAKAYPEENVGRGFRLEPLRSALLGPAARELWILGGAVALVLLITVANVAGLWLVRSHGRRRELAVRTAIGATRRHLATQLLVEATVLAGASWLAAVAVGHVVLRALLALRGQQLPAGSEVSLDARALLFAAACAMATAAFFALAPASGSGSGGAGLGKSTTGRAMSAGARGVLVVAEVALAMILVTGSALLARSVWRLLKVEPGFDPGAVVSFSIQLPEARYPMPPREQYPLWPEMVAAYDRLQERLASVPGVRQVELALNNPLERGFTSQVAIVGRPETEGPQDETRIRPVTPGYQRMLHVPLITGRLLTEADPPGAEAVTLVNAAFARKYFPGASPVGSQVSFWGSELRVVGVVGDERFLGLDRESEPAIYPSLAQRPFYAVRILVASELPTAKLEQQVRAAVAELEPDVGLDDVRPLAATVADSYAQRRFLMLLLASFGTLALVLSAVGIYGVIAFQVAQRRQELGVRQALGAGRRDLVRLVVGEGARLATLGVLLGIGGSLALAPALAAQLFHVRPLDPASLATAAALLVGVGVVAALVPALRAARTDPMLALRQE